MGGVKNYCHRLCVKKKKTLIRLSYYNTAKAHYRFCISIVFNLALNIGVC